MFSNAKNLLLHVYFFFQYKARIKWSTLEIEFRTVDCVHASIKR